MILNESVFIELGVVLQLMSSVVIFVESLDILHWFLSSISLSLSPSCYPALHFSLTPAPPCRGEAISLVGSCVNVIQPLMDFIIRDLYRDVNQCRSPFHDSLAGVFLNREMSESDVLVEAILMYDFKIKKTLSKEYWRTFELFLIFLPLKVVKSSR